jgi:hypothetical protein
VELLIQRGPKAVVVGKSGNAGAGVEFCQIIIQSTRVSFTGCSYRLLDIVVDARRAAFSYVCSGDRSSLLLRLLLL